MYGGLAFRMSRSVHCSFRQPHHVRLPSCWTNVFVCLLCATLVQPVVAINSYALGPVRQHDPSNQGPMRERSFVQFCVFIGAVAFTFSSTLLGPLMGISSMLWLMMRNDSAIDPRLAWMHVTTTPICTLLLTPVGFLAHGYSLV